uniref:Uncharacterized protein n=1 Tax=Anguilla anguilla TaxID=7936 RepID=A0A0E9R915_ANGAN
MLLLKSSNRDTNSHVMLILNRLLFVIMLIELIIVTEIEDLNYNKPRQAFTEKYAVLLGWPTNVTRLFVKQIWYGEVRRRCLQVTNY